MTYFMTNETQKSSVIIITSTIIDCLFKLTNLKTIIAYDVCSTNDATLDTFSYAIERDIEIVIPNNTLKDRNMTLYLERHTSRKAVVS